MYIISALRTILDDQQNLFEQVEDSELISKVLLNNLSNSGLNSTEVNGTYISYASDAVEEVFVANLVKALKSFPERIQIERLKEEEAIDYLYRVYQQICEEPEGAYLIGTLNKQTYPLEDIPLQNELELEQVNRFYEKSKAYLNANHFIDELIHFENLNKEDIFNYVFEDTSLTNYEENLQVKKVNGAIGLLLVKEPFFEKHSLLNKLMIQQFKRIELSKESLVEQIKEELKLLGVSEDWIIEFDYHNFNPISQLLQSEKAFLKNINLSGGSIILGNSKGVSGYRAFVSLVHQLNRSEKTSGLIIVMNEKCDVAYFITLKKIQ